MMNRDEAAQMDKSGEFYAEEIFYAEEASSIWGVFGTESGFCYETYMDEQEATERADLKNHARGNRQ